VNVDEAGNEPISFDQELLPAYRFLRISTTTQHVATFIPLQEISVFRSFSYHVIDATDHGVEVSGYISVVNEELGEVSVASFI
jgi:hypothetical protein